MENRGSGVGASVALATGKTCSVARPSIRTTRKGPYRPFHVTVEHPYIRNKKEIW